MPPGRYDALTASIIDWIGDTKMQWPGGCDVPHCGLQDATAGPATTEEDTSKQYMITGVVVGTLAVVVLVLAIYNGRKYRKRLQRCHARTTLMRHALARTNARRRYVKSLIHHELILAIDIMGELVDLIGDLYSVSYVREFRKQCEAEVCRVAGSCACAPVTRACTGFFLADAVRRFFGVCIPGDADVSLLHVR